MKNFPLFLFLCFILGLLPSETLATASSRASLDDIPLIGRYTISATIGEDQTQYHAQQQGNKHIFHHQAQDLTVTINKKGLHFDNSSHPFTLNLSHYGYDDTLSVVPNATTDHRKNRVELQRGPITEWYVNGPLGLQQGFTLPHPPRQEDRKTNSELHLTLMLQGVQGQLSADGANIDLLNPQGKATMHYGGLTAFDAKGLKLPARLAFTDNTLHIYVDDHAATYPVVIDPLFQQAKLTQDSEANDQQNLRLGFSIAMNNTTVAVGAYGYYGSDGPQRGAVYIYTKSDSGWADMTQTARLLASDGATGDSFGRTVAISSADHLIVVGAHDHDSSRGQAYIFLKPQNVIGGNRWLNRTEDAILTNWPDPEFNTAEFGTSVSISNSTGDIVVGAPAYNARQGSAYLFENPGFPDFWDTDTSYEPTTSLLPDTGTVNFGESVAMDGSHIVVGAPFEWNYRGAAYVFSEPSTGWDVSRSYDMKLAAGDSHMSDPDQFGRSVAINDSTIAVGAPYQGSGAAYLFKIPSTVSGALHNHTSKLLPVSASDSAGFGYSIAMNDSTILVGAPFQDLDGLAGQGQIHLFFKPGSSWPGNETTPVEITEDVHLTSSDGTIGDYVGLSVAIASDNSLAAGSPDRDSNGSDRQGAVYVFLENNSTETAILTAKQSLQDNRFGSAVAINGDTVVIGAPNHATHGVINRGAAYILIKQQHKWTDMKPAALLYSKDGALFDRFGTAVAICNDTVVVGAPQKSLGGRLSQGAAYIFNKPVEGWGGEIVHTAKLSSSVGAAYDYFGNSVAIAGNTVIIGARGEGTGGAVHLFDKEASQPWTNQTSPTARLIASDATTNAQFGSSISISNNIVAIGAPNHDTNGNSNQGAAYVYVEPSAGWESIWTDMEETGMLSVSSGTIDDKLGTSIAIDDDTIVTGAPSHEDSGAAFVFHKPGSGWATMTTATATLFPSDGYSKQKFGYAVAISGKNILCSLSPAIDKQGTAYLFRRTGSAWSDNQENEKLTSDDGHISDWLGAAVAMEGETIIIGAPGMEINETERQGAAYLFDIRKMFPWAMFLPAFIGTEH